MKVEDLMGHPRKVAAMIAKGLVTRAATTYVPEDLEAAVERSIELFAYQIREAAKNEIKLHRNTPQITRQ